MGHWVWGDSLTHLGSGRKCVGTAKMSLFFPPGRNQSHSFHYERVRAMSIIGRTKNQNVNTQGQAEIVKRKVIKTNVNGD